MTGDIFVETRLDEPIVLGSDEVSRAILGGKNIWKRPDNPMDSLIHLGAPNYPVRMNTADSIKLQACRQSSIGSQIA